MLSPGGGRVASVATTTSGREGLACGLDTAGPPDASCASTCPCSACMGNGGRQGGVSVPLEAGQQVETRVGAVNEAAPGGRTGSANGAGKKSAESGSMKEDATAQKAGKPSEGPRSGSSPPKPRKRFPVVKARSSAEGEGPDDVEVVDMVVDHTSPRHGQAEAPTRGQDDGVGASEEPGAAAASSSSATTTTTTTTTGPDIWALLESRLLPGHPERCARVLSSTPPTALRGRGRRGRGGRQPPLTHPHTCPPVAHVWLLVFFSSCDAQGALEGGEGGRWSRVQGVPARGRGAGQVRRSRWVEVVVVW
jgi:hypothetical protein